MTAHHLKQLLAERHSRDVFVPECKMGEAGSRSLDAWALLPTWSPLTAIGYEVKVSRSDWKRDQKFEEYRGCCHLFLIVAPKGIVLPAELPSGVGMLEPVGKGTGTRLVMRVKPIRQDVDHAKLVRLMAHVLMWRSFSALNETRAARLAYWQKWLDEKADGRSISTRVRGRIRLAIRDAEDKARIAEHREQQLADAALVLQQLGITAGYNAYDTRRRIEAAVQGDEVRRAVKAALEALRKVDELIDRGEPQSDIGRTA